MTQHLTIKGTYNVRDLGGLPVEGGGQIKSGVLIRSGNLCDVPESSQQEFIDYGLKTVVDLRDEWESESFPNSFANVPGIRYVNLPLIGNKLSLTEAWKADMLAFESLDLTYAMFLERCQPQIKSIFATIAESTPAILFHCYAGKDRTGIIAALILGAMRVPDALIVEDYVVSRSQIAHLLVQWRAYAIEHNQDMSRMERDSGSEPETMVKTLAHIRSQYGGAANYLRACGVTENQLAQLRAKLVHASL